MKHIIRLGCLEAEYVFKRIKHIFDGKTRYVSTTFSGKNNDREFKNKGTKGNYTDFSDKSKRDSA